MAKAETAVKEVVEGTPAVDPQAQFFAGLTETLAALAAKLQAQPQNDALTDILSQVTETQRQIAAEAREEARKDGPRVSRESPLISAFSYPEGDVLRPKKLNRETWVNGVKQSVEFLSAREVEALNALPNRNVSLKNDTWKSIYSVNGTTEKIDITYPYNTDSERMALANVPGHKIYEKFVLDAPTAESEADFTAQVASILKMAKERGIVLPTA